MADSRGDQATAHTFPEPTAAQGPAGDDIDVHMSDADSQVLYLDGHPQHWHPVLGTQHHASASPPASPTALPTPESPTQTQRLRAMNIKLPSRTWWLDSGSSRPSSPLAALHPEYAEGSFPGPASYSSGSFSSSPSFASSAAPSTPSTPPIDPTKLNNVPVHTPPRDSCPSNGGRRPSITRSPSGSISDEGLAALNLALSRTASPTVAETGLKLVPVDGPSSGQLERKEKSVRGVIRLDSFGGEGLQRKPSGRASFST
ncbi:hypothetical protein Q8F55_003436 [Vanrija albida]|uniref:Uncharacterized protein n=1 Tax=Vanrija albida TaxID=181172 RepID=A0ABR3Q466_9TREE